MIAVLGSGSWATAIVKIISENNSKILWWVREPEIAESVARHGRNPLYLKQCQLDASKIIVETDIRKVIRTTDEIVLVIPSAFVSKSLEGLTREDFRGKRIYSAVKGIVPETNQIVAEYLQTHFGVELQSQAVISGPSHAEVVAQEGLTFLAVASPNQEMAEYMANNIRSSYVKVFTHEDMCGIEYGAVLKNIYAVAMGVAKGLSYGDNALAVLISNAMQEMNAVLNELHPVSERCLEHFAYLGDLLVTAYSQHSRNRTFGNMIGMGYSIQSAQLEMKMVAEGYYATKCMYEILSERNVYPPIIKALYRILYEGCSPHWEMQHLFHQELQ